MGYHGDQLVVARLKLDFLLVLDVFLLDADQRLQLYLPLDSLLMDSFVPSPKHRIALDTQRIRKYPPKKHKSRCEAFYDATEKHSTTNLSK